MIEVIDNWVIDTDEYSYVLKEFTGKFQTKVISKNENGTEIGEAQPLYKNVTYHTTLKGALEHLLRRYQRADVQSGDYTLKEFIEVMDKRNNKFENLLQEILRKESL